MPILYKNNCKHCGEPYVGRGKFFCSRLCATTFKNLANNSSKREDVKKKLRKRMTGNTYSVGRKLSNETKIKISKSLKGRSLPEEVRKKISQTLRNIGHKPSLYAYQKLPKGEKHPNWKGGISPQRHREYGTKEYKQFVKSVLERDDYTCQWCGAKNGKGENIKLHTHHIESYAEYPELRFDVKNGLTLCDECHYETLRGKRRPARVDKIYKTHICQKCGKEFKVRNPRKFYPDCQNLICIICGMKFRVRNGKYSQKFCSRKCYGIWQSKNRMGDNNSNWKEYEIRYCINCQNEIIRRRNEAIVTYNKRFFCCLRCVYDYRKK